MTTTSTSKALPRKVLAIGAHPDDLELSCAGTLARYLRAGVSVHLAVACRGDRGGHDGPDPALALVREEEAYRAAKVLGAPMEHLNLGDAEVPDTFATRLLFLRLLRTVRPDLIITHAPTDYHDDHVRVGALATNCAWFAASPGHATDQEPLDAPPAVVYMDNVAGINFEPTHLVDITESMAVKRQMLACHRSQVARTDGALSKLEEMAETLAKLRGLQCGVAYAEGFRPALLWGRRRPEPIFP
jgi:LmbE family N-acetylglucosaminyl deacetylase